MKRMKQYIAILLLSILVVSMNLAMYFKVTNRVVNKYEDTMGEKSIDLEKYLPFKEDSNVKKIDTKIKIEGDLPVLDGATALYPIFSGLMNSIYPEGTCEYVDGDFTDKSYIQKTGTTGAYKGLVDGNVDLIFCAKPSQKQLDYAKDKNVEFEMIPIGYEAFVFIVNSKNSIDNLTIDQVKGIYTGKYTNWKELGGDNARIVPTMRSEGSGSQTSMDSFMGEEKQIEPKNIFFGKSIGYSFRYYVNEVVADGNIKMLSLNGVYPSKENIQTNKYPIIANFYAIYRKDDNNENISKIVEWILSDEGQKLIEDVGYIPLD